MTALERTAPKTYRGFSLPKIGVSGWVIAGALIVSASAMAPVIQNSLMTTQGRNLQVLEGQHTTLRIEIRQLEAEIARLVSVERIARRASEIGLVPGASTIFVTIGEAGPEPPKIPAEHLLEHSEPGSGLAP
ncbi:MAG: hypothetical protein CL897_00945 [Dehalococcoidia bacterium]|nr:hypothetical protein [Dehalococcoidia bacterium]|tara:strand:- start:66 stop:461 length:396 start_codon:yes stop_codon:yes gene_type:complete